MQTPEQLDARERNALLGLLRGGSGSRMAADQVGCGWARYVHTLRRDPGFRADVRHARAVAREDVLAAMHAKALGGNFQAQKHVLARLDAERAMRAAAGMPAVDPDAPQLTRADIRLRQRAVRNRWDVPPAMIEESIFQVHQILISPAADERTKARIVSLMQTMVAQDQADDKQAFERSKHEKDKAELDARDALLREAEELIDEGPEGPR